MLLLIFLDQVHIAASGIYGLAIYSKCSMQKKLLIVMLLLFLIAYVQVSCLPFVCRALLVF